MKHNREARPLTTAKLACVAANELPQGVRLYDLQRSAVHLMIWRGWSARKFAAANQITEDFAVSLIVAYFGDESARKDAELRRAVNFAPLMAGGLA